MALPNVIPSKVFVKDLSQCRVVEGKKLQLDVPKINKPMETIPFTFDSVIWIQGTIEQTACEDKDIIIISDKTGKAKITECSKLTISGDRSWIVKGAYCSVIGQFVTAKGLPTILAQNIKCIIQNHNGVDSKALWSSQVQELKYIQTNQALPILKDYN